MKNLLKVLLIANIFILTNSHILFGQNTFPSSGDAFIANQNGLYLSRSTSNNDGAFIRVSNPYYNLGWGWPDKHERALIFKADAYVDSYGAGGGGFLFITKDGNENLIKALSIRRNGQIGIGTLTPSEKLTVNGTIKAEEVIVVENVGADFVFDEDYKLPGLNRVEAYIKQHNHLPEIPSAEEMKKSGVKMGALQMKLLQKIEELTLYVIKQQKRIEVLEQEINEKNY